MLENLDRLKPFYFVFTTGSVGEAAKTLHVTQPAVSQALQKLEGELGTPLFIRQHKKLIPTTAANQLHAVVEPFMRDLDNYLSTISFAQDQPHGELCIGAPPEFGKEYLPVIMTSFRRKYPDVFFKLKLNPTEKLIPQVSEGKLDFALVDLFLINPGYAANTTNFHFEPVVKEKIVLACSTDYKQERMGGPVSLELLAKQDFIEYSSKTRTIEHWFKHHYNATKIPFRTVMTVDNHETIIAAIKQHTGLGIVASHIVTEDIQRGEITTVSTMKEDIVNQISFMQLQDKVPTLTEKVFKQHMMDSIKELGL